MKFIFTLVFTCLLQISCFGNITKIQQNITANTFLLTNLIQQMQLILVKRKWFY